MLAARLSNKSHVAVLAVGLALVGCTTEDPDDGGNTVPMGGMSGGVGGVGGLAGGGAGGLGGGGAGGNGVGGASGGMGGAAGVAGGGAGGLGGGGGSGGMTGGSGGDGMDAAVVDDRKFSFFVTSLEGMRRLSGSQDGFGGDLGGIEGADAICQQLAEGVGAGHKTWRAFLSATAGGEGGGPIHAIERIGTGPWYDANERLIAMNIEGLLDVRPDGDPQATQDMCDENGAPSSELGDSHDTLTGSNQMGRLKEGSDLADTCQDWTSAVGEGSGDNIVVGHSWPRCLSFGGCGDAGMEPPFPGFGFGGPGGGGDIGSFWIDDHTAHGCAPGVNLVQDGAGDPTSLTVGAGGGYGGIYCFALTP